MDISIDNIFWNLLTIKTEKGCSHDRYKQWENETKELKTKLQKRGEINVTPKTWEHEQYWGNDAPIVFSKYPYHSCEIYQCKDCKEFFFHYIEDGGHGSQKRYRIIDINLIDKKDFTPNTKSTIDYESDLYSIEKHPNGDFELVTFRHDIGIGIDIRHIMNNEETLAYLKNGINEVKERMTDMKENYQNYKVNSWR